MHPRVYFAFDVKRISFVIAFWTDSRGWIIQTFRKRMIKWEKERKVSPHIYIYTLLSFNGFSECLRILFTRQSCRCQFGLTLLFYFFRFFSFLFLILPHWWTHQPSRTSIQLLRFRPFDLYVCLNHSISNRCKCNTYMPRILYFFFKENKFIFF